MMAYGLDLFPAPTPGGSPPGRLWPAAGIVNKELSYYL